MAKVRKHISLDGDWEFAYRQEAPSSEERAFPRERDYEITMPVPGYWDDHTERLRYAKFWSRDVRQNLGRRIERFPLGAGKPADASLPYLIGTGWYKKKFTADAEWVDSCVTLHIGGCSLEAWVWLNGKFLVHHIGHLTPFEVDLSKALEIGSQNELIIAVANTRADRTGCSIRGYKGKSAGITRSIALKVSKLVQITDCYVRPDQPLQNLLWEVKLQKTKENQPLTVDWEVVNRVTEEKITSGSFDTHRSIAQWTSESVGLECWSDVNPNLYKIRLTVRDGEHILDQLEQSFGFRYLESIKGKVLLNGEPIFLRGVTDHAYFPESCTVPTELSFYMDSLKKLKTIGFNWIRFHTWTPPEELLVAADELGMLLQVEASNGFKDSEWLDILRTCRKHPSVAVYCCGNEVRLDDAMIDRLESMADLCHRFVPEALFNPMEGMRGIEYDVDRDDPGYVAEPYPLNLGRLNRLKPFSDLFSPHGGIFSGGSLKTDDEVMENRLSMYERPCLMHEVGIRDSYINLDLEHRYVGTRIGTDLYSSARAYLKEMGLESKAPLYYQNSCRWMQQIIKYSLELTRRCGYIVGYDLLGGIDCHWHRSGYGVGMLNEFYELKPGYTVEGILRYNGESVVLADVGTNRNLQCGETLTLPVYASLFGDGDLEEGILEWRLIDDRNKVYVCGEQPIERVVKGDISNLGDLVIDLPRIDLPKHVRLEVCLTGGSYHVTNSWDYWIFPVVEALSMSKSSVRVVEQLDREVLDYIEDGGKVLLLGSDPFPNLETTFQIMAGGRTQGNNATVVYDHPLTRNFPHDGYCDWQFYAMLEGANTVVFNDLKIPFEPIVEMVGTYKMIRKQASLFELRIGKGGLLVCTFNLKSCDPAAMYLQQSMMRYLDSSEFVPKVTVTSETVAKLLCSSIELDVDFSTDEGYDDGGHVLPVAK